MSTYITLDTLRPLLKPRATTSHKGDHGHVLIIAGDSGYAGAATICAHATARTGAGLVSLATHPHHAHYITITVPEIMSHPIHHAHQLHPLLAKANTIAIGPGLGQSSWGTALLSTVMDNNLPLVMDADALNLLAKEPCYSDRWILTPHPGEAARLLNCSTTDIQSDRTTAAQAIQKKFGGIIVLKGHNTVIVDGNTQPSICSDGNPGMASGGMGDALTGIIASLLAQRTSSELSALNAARLGVCLHAAAADKAAIDGKRGMLASDLLPWIRRLANALD